MSERDELIECLRVCGACHGCGIGADGDTCTNCGDERQLNRLAASLLERDSAELERLRAEVARLTAENDWLRAYTGQSAKDCIYCGLGADEQGECNRGFPGCARADDQMLCREVEVAMERDELLARVEAAAREAVAAWMIEHAFATGHGDTLTDLLAELSWQIAEIKRDAIKWRDTPIPVPPGECPYPVHADHSIKACVAAGDCGCGQNKT